MKKHFLSCHCEERSLAKLTLWAISVLGLPRLSLRSMARNDRRRAFTLIEILIAVAIFSTVMVIASGIFSNIIGNQSLVNVSSDVNREGQRVLRQISDDTVNAVSTGTINYDPSIQAKGILFLNLDYSLAKPGTNCISNAAVGCSFGGIVLFSKDSKKIYRYNSAQKEIDYAIDTSLNADGSLTPLVFDNSIPKKLNMDSYKFSKLNSDNVEIVSNGFSGFSCYNASCSQAPFIKIDMTTETKDYSNKSPHHRAKLELRTIVTGRSY